MTESQIDTTFFIEVGLEILGWTGTVLQDNDTIKSFTNNIRLFTFICFANECNQNKMTKGFDTNQTLTNKLCLKNATDVIRNYIIYRKSYYRSMYSKPYWLF